jgi:hypothetical protein
MKRGRALPNHDPSRVRGHSQISEEQRHQLQDLCQQQMYERSQSISRGNNASLCSNADQYNEGLSSGGPSNSATGQRRQPTRNQMEFDQEIPGEAWRAFAAASAAAIEDLVHVYLQVVYPM